MNIPITWARTCALVCLALPLAWGTAKAGDTAASPAPSKAKKSKTKAVQPKSAKVKFLPSSEETVAQRRARLKAECKGQVDAGACSGLTH